MNKFFIKENNIEKGPLSYNELYNFVGYSKNYLIWYKGLDSWVSFEKSNIYTQLVKEKEIGAKKNQLYHLLSKASIISFITFIILIALPYNSFTRVFFQKNIVDIYPQILILVLISFISIRIFKWNVLKQNRIFIEKDKNPNKKYFYIIPVILLIIQILYFLIKGFYSEKSINYTYSEIQIQNDLEYDSILGKRGLINSKENKIIIPPVYGEIIYFNSYINDSSLFIVKKDKQLFKTGVVNMQNNIIVPFETQNIDFLNEKTFLISKTIDGKEIRGVINSEGHIVIPFTYRLLEPISDTYMVASFIDDKNVFIINIKNEKVSRNYTTFYFRDGKFVYLVYHTYYGTNGAEYTQGDLYDFENRIIYHKLDRDIAQKIVDKQYFRNVQTSKF